RRRARRKIDDIIQDVERSRHSDGGNLSLIGRLRPRWQVIHGEPMAKNQISGKRECERANSRKHEKYARNRCVQVTLSSINAVRGYGESFRCRAVSTDICLTSCLLLQRER